MGQVDIDRRHWMDLVVSMSVSGFSCLVRTLLSRMSQITSCLLGRIILAFSLFGIF